MARPFVEEIRKVREAHTARFGYDLRAIYRALKEEEAASERKFMRLQPQRIKAEEEQT